MTLPVTTGVELELWVTDDRGELADGRAIAGAHPRIEDEFVPCLLEVKTCPHGTERGLRHDLEEVLRTAVDAAAEHGLRLVPLGTPLTEADVDATGRRGELFEEIYGDGVVPAKNCAGSHVHFEKGNVRRQLNVLTALDPALSLVSSSPYYRGERNLDCSRAIAYRSYCGRDFRQFCGLLDYVDSLEEWEVRTGGMYEDFCRLARQRGVSRGAVADHFSPEDTVLNPVRLRQSQPTVEWRAPDSTLPSQVVSLAVDVGSIVAQTESKPLEYGAPGVTDGRIGVPDVETLRRLSRTAIRSGCQTPAVTEYLQKMGVSVHKYDPVSAHEDGPAVLSEAAARRKRLEAAERLERDLQDLADGRASDPLSCPQVSTKPAQGTRAELPPYPR